MGYRQILGSMVLVTTLATATTPVTAQEIYETDQGHTEIFFGWSHANVSMQHGEFTRASGTLALFPKDPEKSSIQVTIDASSLTTGFEALDTELKGSSWLNTDKFPEITFQSSSIELTGKHTAKVTGDLTLHGITRPVVLVTKLLLRGTHPVGKWIQHYKGPWTAFHATATIDHQAFGIGNYSTGPISIEINTELKGK